MMKRAKDQIAIHWLDVRPGAFRDLEPKKATTDFTARPSAGTKSTTFRVFLVFVDPSDYLKRRGTTKDAKDTKTTDAKKQEVEREVSLTRLHGRPRSL
jgi:hypothetical protein